MRASFPLRSVEKDQRRGVVNRFEAGQAIKVQAQSDAQTQLSGSTSSVGFFDDWAGTWLRAVPKQPHGN
jgi:hypothetical protein